MGRLGTVLAALLLAALLGAASGCGDEGADTAVDEPTPTAGQTASTVASVTADGAEGAPDPELVGTISETNAGGTVSPVAAPLTEEGDLLEFTDQFEGDALAAQVQQAVAQTSVPEGMALYGAVVAVGCDSPDDVSVTAHGAELLVTAVPVKGPEVQCFAPVTTVALVAARR